MALTAKQSRKEKQKKNLRREAVQSALRLRREEGRRRLGKILNGIFNAALANKKLRLRLDRLFTDPAVLFEAAARMLRARGRRTAGVDGVKPIDLSMQDLEALVLQTAQRLRGGTYLPMRCRKKLAAKQYGKARTLRLLAVADRLAQYSALILLEVVVEADLSPGAFGGRSGVGVVDAIIELRDALLKSDGALFFVKTDIKSFFDQVEHRRLKRLLDARVAGSILVSTLMKQLKVWNKMRGIPTGAPLSPLLCNVFLSHIDRKLETRTVAFIRYYDDIIMIVRGGRAEAEAALSELKSELASIGLSVAETKTVVSPASTKLEVLGFYIRRLASGDVEISCSEKNIARQKEKIDNAIKAGIDIAGEDFTSLRAALTAAVANINVFDEKAAKNIADHFRDTFKVAPLRTSEDRLSRHDRGGKRLHGVRLDQVAPDTSTTAPRTCPDPDSGMGMGARVGTGREPPRVDAAHERSSAGATRSRFGPAALLGVPQEHLHGFDTVDIATLALWDIHLHQDEVLYERDALGAAVAFH